jgi:hypothetical protein
MKLLVEIRIASSEARNTTYVPVVVDAKNGGAAQRQAMAVTQQKYPHMRVSGGTVYNATDEAIAAAEERFGCKALYETVKAEVDETRLAPQVGVPKKPKKAVVEAEPEVGA